MITIPSLNLTYLGRKDTKDPSLNLTVDRGPLNMKSNHSLAPEISPIIEINRPKYAMHMLTSSSLLNSFVLSMAENTFLAFSLNRISPMR